MPVLNGFRKAFKTWFRQINVRTEFYIGDGNKKKILVQGNYPTVVSLDANDISNDTVNITTRVGKIDDIQGLSEIDMNKCKVDLVAHIDCDGEEVDILRVNIEDYYYEHGDDIEFEWEVNLVTYLSIAEKEMNEETKEMRPNFKKEKSQSVVRRERTNRLEL